MNHFIFCLCLTPALLISSSLLPWKPNTFKIPRKKKKTKFNTHTLSMRFFWGGGFGDVPGKTFPQWCRGYWDLTNLNKLLWFMTESLFQVTRWSAERAVRLYDCSWVSDKAFHLLFNRELLKSNMNSCKEGDIYWRGGFLFCQVLCKCYKGKDIACLPTCYFTYLLTGYIWEEAFFFFTVMWMGDPSLDWLADRIVARRKRPLWCFPVILLT